MAEDRAVVKTYVPQYQKDQWKAHAAELEMSQSEFLRTMVQAGRSKFEVPSVDKPVQSEDGTDHSVEDRILAVLGQKGVLSWDDLVSELIDDVKGDLEDALEQLQRDNEIRYSGRESGYTVVDNE